MLNRFLESVEESLMLALEALHGLVTGHALNGSIEILLQLVILCTSYTWFEAW